MKIRPAQLVLLLVLASLAMLISGCATTESDNNSERPWNSPAGWESGGALGGMDGMQHR
ncbi:MAG TPA: hypothetical protein VG347_07450 [Verrucomicrobiae bacterium]|nr:hypothetical protein [Verrucomicrobiae bacterium]